MAHHVNIAQLIVWFYAADCNSAYVGSIPASVSNLSLVSEVVITLACHAKITSSILVRGAK